MRPSVRVNKGKINKKLKENNKSIASQENNRMETELERWSVERRVPIEDFINALLFQRTKK